MSAPRIPGYTYVEHIGSGGFADVYLYEQEWPRQRVAVKVVRPDVPLDAREKAMFTSEANAMARLADHPYIVSVITAGITPEAEGGRPFLVMRYCPPPDLGVRVRTTPMSVADAVSTGIKLASAIETAHRSGILHRDIKPSNVLVTTYNEPALSDFGIAGHMHEVGSEQEVRISYPWSPPELLDGRSNGSVASDVYSLGATIWNLLTGRSPFAIPNADNSPRALTARILHAAPPATQRPDVPPALDRLLQQCLAKDPAHRPASALELARSLQRIETAAGFSRTPIAVEGDQPAVLTPAGSAATAPDATHVKPATVAASGPAPTPSTAATPGGRSPHLWWALALASVVAVALVAFVLARPDSPDDAGPQPDPTDPGSSHTPLPLDPAVAVKPVVSGVRAGERVTFSWKAADRARAGDSWEWRRVDTGQTQRVQDRELVVSSPTRICLQVRLIRGNATSPWEETCVS